MIYRIQTFVTPEDLPTLCARLLEIEKHTAVPLPEPVLETKRGSKVNPNLPHQDKKKASIEQQS